MPTGKRGSVRRQELEVEAARLNHQAGYRAYSVVRIRGGYALQQKMNLDGIVQGRMF
jgi:hypothetical protein